MRLRIYQALEGDALVLSEDDEDGNWTHVLIDGGRQKAYRQGLRTRLPLLETSPDETAPSLDLVVVSHIDSDHIEGLLRYADDLMAWRVYDHLQGQAAGDPALTANLSPPDWPRPPTPTGIWHNAFHEVVGDNAGDISEMLAALTARYELPADPDVASDHSAAAAAQWLAAGEKQAHHLSRRISADELNIPLNGEIGGQLMRVRDPQPAFQVGSLSLSVLGPSEADLDDLRARWNDWLQAAENQAALQDVRETSEAYREDLGHPDLDAVAAHLRAGSTPPAAEWLAALAEASGHPPDIAVELGLAGNVSEPNHASLMLLAEAGAGAGRRRILLTGDGHHARILEGLQRVGVLAAGTESSCHVDVLKVPHHGSEHNADEAFFRRVIADHYVFCADGSHHNPDLQILDALFDSRVGPAPSRSVHAKVGDAFTIWVATHPDHPLLATRETARTYLWDHAKPKIDAWVAAQPVGHVSVHWGTTDDPLELNLVTVSTAPVAPGRLRITAVLPNPTGSDAGEEWVEITNSAASSMTLSGLDLEDRQRGRVPLDGLLAPGATRRVMLPPNTPIVLANRGDDMKLMDGMTVIDRVTWSTPAKSGVPLLFSE